MITRFAVEISRRTEQGQKQGAAEFGVHMLQALTIEDAVAECADMPRLWQQIRIHRIADNVMHVYAFYSDVLKEWDSWAGGKPILDKAEQERMNEFLVSVAS